MLTLFDSSSTQLLRQEERCIQTYLQRGFWRVEHKYADWNWARDLLTA